MVSLDLPWNDEAEKRILYVLLSSTDSAQVLDKLSIELHLTLDDFYGNTNKKIYAAIQELCAAEQPVDIATVANKINCAASEQDMKTLKYIANMFGVENAVTYYAKIVKQLSERRKYINMAQTVLSLAANTSQPFKKITDEIEEAIKSKDESGGMVPLKSIMADTYGDIVERYSGTSKLSGTPTEWNGINKLTGGLSGGDFIVVGGRPGMGKSIVGQNIAEHMAFVEKKKSLLFTLEMPKEQLSKRILSARTGIPYSKFKNGDVDGDDFMRMGFTMESEGMDNIYIDDTSRIDINYIKAVSRMMKRKFNELGVIVIDYLGLLQLPEKSRSRWEGISEITRELKMLAKEINTPIVALSQITREVEKEKSKRPMLSDLRDSGSLEQDADMVFLLYRDEYYRPETTEKGILEVILAKIRDGKPGVVKLSWQPQIMRAIDPIEVKRMKAQAEELKRKKYGEQVDMEAKTK